MGGKNEQWRAKVAFLAIFLAWVASPLLAQSTLVVDDDGQGSAANCNDAAAAFSSISAAVGAAIAGDTILVCPGTYTEQVTIGASKSNLTLQSVLALGATIKAPSSMLDPKAIVDVNGATGVSILDFKIAGPGGGTCLSLRSGVFVRGGGSATIQGNRIKDIRDNPLSDCQDGIGIMVGLKSASETGTATITGNEIVDYQKGGIVVDNTGSSATITGNDVVGTGPTEIIGQNGIQVSRGATAAVTGNRVRNNFYLNSRAASDPNCPEGSPGPDVGQCIITATGILFFQSGSPRDPGQLNSQNTLRHNQINVVVIP